MKIISILFINKNIRRIIRYIEYFKFYMKYKILEANNGNEFKNILNLF